MNNNNGLIKLFERDSGTTRHQAKQTTARLKPCGFLLSISGRSPFPQPGREVGFAIGIRDALPGPCLPRWGCFYLSPHNPQLTLDVEEEYLGALSVSVGLRVAQPNQRPWAYEDAWASPCAAIAPGARTVEEAAAADWQKHPALSGGDRPQTNRYPKTRRAMPWAAWATKARQPLTASAP